MPASRFLLTGRIKAARLPYVPALVELRLPQGFHDLPPAQQRIEVEAAMASALAQANKVISLQGTTAA